MEGEDMDSLFEGMVLFNPAQIEADNQQKNHSDDSIQNRKSDAATSVQTTGSCSGSQSQPLDENLFSDLTLVVDPLQNLEVGEAEHDLQPQSCQHQQPSTITSSRQSFRRRKRSGLKIGYGRDTVDLSQYPSPLPQPTPKISESPSLPVDSISIGDTDVAVTQPSTSSESITITTDVAVTQSQLSGANESENENDRHADDETSSEAEFRQIEATIHDKLNHARQLVNSASAVRKDAIRSRRKTVEDANLASLKYMELEKQLEEAIEAEDFDRAEKVSEHLSAAEKEKQIFANSLREADALIDSLDLKLQHALDSHIAAEEECAILLDQYATVSEKVEVPFFTLFLPI